MRRKLEDDKVIVHGKLDHIKSQMRSVTIENDHIRLVVDPIIVDQVFVEFSEKGEEDGSLLMEESVTA